MGMFDYINFKAACKKCREQITEWQSKDSHCRMDLLEPEEVNNFYGSCDKCKEWNRYEVIPPTEYHIRLVEND